MSIAYACRQIKDFGLIVPHDNLSNFVAVWQVPKNSFFCRGVGMYSELEVLRPVLGAQGE